MLGMWYHSGSKLPESLTVNKSHNWPNCTSLNIYFPLLSIPLYHLKMPYRRGSGQAPFEIITSDEYIRFKDRFSIHQSFKILQLRDPEDSTADITNKVKTL